MNNRKTKNYKPEVGLKIYICFIFIVLFQLNNEVIIASEGRIENTNKRFLLEQVDQIISGTVSDEGGNVLPGATIEVKGEGVGTTADFDGKFTVTASEAATTLIISYLGYETQEVLINGRTEINVILVEGANTLDEIVVIGYGTTKKRDLTGAVASIDLEDSPIANVTNVNLLESLRGTTSGLNIGPVTSAGGTPDVLIRGKNTITAGNFPLIVLDGMIFTGRLNEINTNDIASFDILKDASSAAIYGSRSANGVIVITTKKGKSGKPVVGFNISSGIQSWTRQPDMRKGEDFIQWRRDNQAIRGNENLSTEEILFPLEFQAYNEGHTTDWYDEVTQVAPVTDFQANVSGKTDKTNYYVSGNLIEQKGILVNDNYKQFSLTSKLDFTITHWLKAGLNGYYSQSDYSGNAPSLSRATYMSPYSYKYVPEYPDQLHRFPAQTSTLINPLWDAQADNMDKRFSIRAIAYFEVDIYKGLTYRFETTAFRTVRNRGTFAHENLFISTLEPEQIEDPSPFLNSANGGKREDFSTGYVINNLLNYKNEIGNHRFDILLGYTRESTTLEYTQAGAADFAAAGTTVLGWNGLHLANSEKKQAETGLTEFSNIGYIARLNYVYKDKYHATFNFRRDGYSGFGEDNKFGNFPGAALAWTISEENFAKNIGYLKIRASYGQNGNQAIAPYATFAKVGSGQTVFGDQTYNYSFPSTLGNKDLTWETTTAFNFGVNFSIINDRLAGDINLYSSKTEDQLLTRNIPIMTGYQSVLTNIGQVDNKGFEIQLTSVNMRTESGFEWSSGLAYWMNRNELVSLYGVDADGDGVEDDDTGNGWFIGESLGAVFDFTTEGIVQTEDTDYINTYGSNPGDLKIKDISGPDGVPDGVIDAEDRSIIGNTNPNYNFNISNTLSYKGLQLYFDINVLAGGGGNNYLLAQNRYALNPGQYVSEVANWLNREYWMPDNQSQTTVRPNYGNPFGYGFWQKHGFVRLQNVSLSYDFKQHFFEKTGIEALKVYASGRNLLTSTDWIGLDPENAGHIAGPNPGIRTVSLGFNISF